MEFLVQARKLAHLAAVGVMALMAFMETPAGRALVAQYPHLDPIVAAIGMLVAIYSNPNKKEN